MTSQKKRTYSSSSRQKLAKATKERILTSAKYFFESVGFENVTIDNIAEKAEVSAPTIYAIFKSKKNILKTLVDYVVPKEDYEGLISQIRQEKSAKKRLAISAKLARRIYDAEREQAALFMNASIISPELKELEKEREMRRYKRQEESIKIMKKEGSLNIKLTQGKARDLLWAFTGRDIYRMLVIEQNWTSNEYEAWLAEELAKLLL